MNIFITLLVKIFPLYILIALGYLAGKKLNAKKETVASVLIYIITPVVVFNSIVSMKINPELLLLPLIFFICCLSISLFFYQIGKFLFNDSTKNILALAAGTANTGYFGIPVAIELFGEKSIGIMILSILGFTLFENSVGFFITARGTHTAYDSFKKLLKLPTIYAFALGLIVNYCGFSPNEAFTGWAKNFLGTYTISGMMLIGMGLSDIKKFEFDFKFLLTSFTAKFIVWPLVILLIVFIDTNFCGLFTKLIHKVMFLLAIVPLAVNMVAYATELKAHPEKASLAVFLSTLVALVYIPFLTTLFFK